MSDAYLMPVSSTKTNGSYVVPTTSKSSILSRKKKAGEQVSSDATKKEGGFGKKISRIFKGSSDN